MKLNTYKCHLLISGNKNEYMWAKLDQDIVWERNDLELLGLTTGSNLRFNKLNMYQIFVLKQRES